jgi:hypothetical protein
MVFVLKNENIYLFLIKKITIFNEKLNNSYKLLYLPIAKIAFICQ